MTTMPQSPSVLNLADLRKAYSTLLDEVERRFGDRIDLQALPVDHYWTVGLAAAFAMGEVTDMEIGCGQATDDVKEVAALAKPGQGELVALWHGLDHLAGAIRLLAFMDLPRSGTERTQGPTTAL